MLTLNQVLARCPTVLVLDAASEVIQVGVLVKGSPARWHSVREGAGTGLFPSLEALQASPDSFDAFAFCDGPGSILGIRTAAIAIRTWQVGRARPVYAYSSLALAALFAGRTDHTLIADARRGTWHHYRPGENLRRVKADQLQGALATPEGFRAWTPLPASVLTVPYSVADTLAHHPDVPLFSETAEPDAFLHEEPAYAHWTPQIHRAP